MEHGFETLIDAIHSERECMDLLNGFHPVIQGPMIGYDATEITEERIAHAERQLDPDAVWCDSTDELDQIPF